METARLNIRRLAATDATFIMTLVNTPGWLRFIGERNVRTAEDADAYVSKIMANPQISYWVATLKDSNQPVGIVTLIQRDYLECPDIGFAMLPDFEGGGFAAEATKAILEEVAKAQTYRTIKAITLKDNTRSILLLQRLGFCFQEEIQRDGDILLVFEMDMVNTPEQA